jgi:hypothetical protein
MVTPESPVPTVLISMRWLASLLVTDIVPDTAPLMARFRLESVARPLTEPAALNVRSSHWPVTWPFCWLGVARISIL